MPRSSLPNIKSISKGSFEPIKKNAISLGDDDYLGEELKPLKIGGKISILELSETDFKINGNLKDLHLTENFTMTTLGNSITFDTYGGDINFQAAGKNVYTFDVFGTFKMYPAVDRDDYAQFAVGSGGCLTITTFDDTGEVDNFGDITLNADGDIVLDAVVGTGIGILLKNEGTTIGMVDIHHSATYFTLYENGGASTDDYFNIVVGADGSTVLGTHDEAGADADLRMKAD